jgi:photosystem II stability/assembly factor-like uncharacterized protein
MKMRQLKAVFKFGYKTINLLSLWRYLRYLIFGLAVAVLIFSWFSRMPDLGTRNWKRIQTRGIWGRILGIHFSDYKSGWLIIEKNGIAFTENAAKSWRWQWLENKNGPPYLSAKKLYFLTRDTGWALGKVLIQENQGVFSNHPFVTYTKNGGKIWNTIILKQPEVKDAILKDIYFIDTSYGWAVGYPGIILKSNDGGKTWEVKARDMDFSHEKTATGFSSVFFMDQNTGWLCGEGGIILYTQDGGNIWREQYCGDKVDLQKILFVNKEQGWCIGGPNIFYTSNGGEKWELQFRYEDGGIRFCDLSFINPSIGYAITSRGHLFKTSDGGKNWDLESTFVRESNEQQGGGGKTWHAFLNRLFTTLEHQESSGGNWMLSVITKDRLKILAAEEKGGLFVYPAYEETKISDTIMQRIILVAFTVIFIGILFWIRYAMRKGLSLHPVFDKLYRHRLKLAWSSVTLSIIPLILVFLLSVITYYLHLYAPTNFIYKLLLNFINPLLSILATACISASFLAAVISLLFIKNDKQLNQQLNLSFLGIFFSILAFIIITNWFMY